MDKTMKEKQKKKQQLILDAAVELFLENGYEKTKISDIARRAGIGKGTVYEYFESKEALFRHLLESYCSYYTEAVEDALQQTSGAPALKKLRAIMDVEHALFSEVNSHTPNPMTPLQFQMEFNHFPGLHSMVLQMFRFKFDTTCRILQEGIDSGELRRINVSLAAIMLMGSCPLALGVKEHPFHHAITDVAVDDFTADTILDMMMHGLCA